MNVDLKDGLLKTPQLWICQVRVVLFGSPLKRTQICFRHHAHARALADLL